MCVIIVKPIGATLPSNSVLKDCWEANPHGAGFAVSPLDANPFYHKGYMTFESFMDSMQWHDIVESALVLHFRIATHGSVSKANCHPFPLTDDISAMRKLKGNHTCILAHNGIFSISTPKTHSDTMQAISEMGDSPELWWLAHPHIVRGSKLAILRPYGEYKLLGQWEASDGCFYSNLNHEAQLYYPQYRVTQTTDMLDLPATMSDEEFDDMDAQRDPWNGFLGKTPSMRGVIR